MHKCAMMRILHIYSQIKNRSLQMNKKIFVKYTVLYRNIPLNTK